VLTGNQQYFGYLGTSENKRGVNALRQWQRFCCAWTKSFIACCASRVCPVVAVSYGRGEEEKIHQRFSIFVGLLKELISVPSDLEYWLSRHVLDAWKPVNRTDQLLQYHKTYNTVHRHQKEQNTESSWKRSQANLSNWEMTCQALRWNPQKGLRVSKISNQGNKYSQYWDRYGFFKFKNHNKI
jgi:hypothetical protein